LNIKKRNQTGYSQLKLKLFFQMLSLLGIAFTISFIIYKLIWSDKGGNWVTSIFQNFFKIDHSDALNMYNQLFRNHEEIIWLLAVMIIFVLLFYYAVQWFTQYFDLLNKEIASLKDNNHEIHLPPELAAAEQELSSVRQTLYQRKIEAELAEQKKNDLVMYLAHDIRTPLTSVIGYLNLMEEANDMPAEQREKYIHIALDKANRLERMVNEFFEITRYHVQYIDLSKEVIDLHYMLIQLSDEFSSALLKHKNTITLKANENLTVYGDADQLARVFNNILKNAIAYSYPETEIFIVAKENKGNIEIAFKNKGKTIPKEKLSSIFEKFYRLDESRMSNTGGSGLGLAIAKEIVTLHGGTIAAESQNNTVTFLVTLPVENSAWL